MAEKKLWELTITSEDTAHDDHWPLVDVISATDEEMAQLERDLGDQLYTSRDVSSATDVATWRNENSYLFEDSEGDGE